MRLTNKEKSKEESNHPYGDETHESMDKGLKASAFALCKNSLVEEHKAYFDHSQRWDLHQFNGPQDLESRTQRWTPRLWYGLQRPTFLVVCC